MGVDYRLKSMKVEEPISPSPLELQRIGDQFKQVRQDKSLSLEEVTVSTKISRSNLHAIESMEYDKLPADSFRSEERRVGK